MQGRQALVELLEVTQARADGAQPSALDHVAGGETSRADVLWIRLQAIQAQAQIHATLALKDVVFERGL
ncbi:hypothetical protein [Nocardia niigatensis]|uniref:hypothetical protein n=1 Tax=Nocardia niigatensis TaxID=209249 RepID=UPI0002DDA6C3|nr:hypothetical protein [Nocardia niigatensis]